MRCWSGGPGADTASVAGEIRRWKHLQAYTRPQMEEILVSKLIATSARQIGMFLVILAIVSAAIVAFIIYTMTLGKIREIAVLKLIGTRNRTIAGMILQQALGLGLIGFMVGKTAATVWAPFFPKYVLLEPGDAARGLLVVMVICALASTLAIRSPCGSTRRRPSEVEWKASGFTSRVSASATAKGRPRSMPSRTSP
jgi:putative ABC transport system permease protein